MAKVLLLDDEPETLTWMSAALTSRGHEVAAYREARAALDAVDAFAPEVVLADVLMPDMDGLAFTRLVQSHHVPVVLVSIAKKEAEGVLAGAVGFVRKPATAAEVREAVDRVLGNPRRRATILIVDDDPDVCMLYDAYLASRFDVMTASNGALGLAAMRAHSVDLAIVDVHMPVMNGVELVRAMRADPALERMPVIVQTSDRAALGAPVWAALHVSHVMDKLSFVDWFERQLDASAVPSATS